MSKRIGIRNLLSFGIIAILISTTFIPAVDTHILNTESLKSDRTTISIENEKTSETVGVTCRIFKPNGVEEMNREITVEQAENLSNFLKNAEDREIAIKLKELDLLPKEMTIEQAQSMIKGNQIPKIGREFQEFENNNGRKKNYFCHIYGFGIFVELSFIDDILMSIVGILGIWVIYYIVVANVIPRIRFPLDPFISGLGNGYIKTVGLNGTWKIGSLLSPANLDLVILGFIGIWVQFPLPLPQLRYRLFGVDWFSGFAAFVWAERYGR